MKIYTRTGDAGQTGLFGGARVDKDDASVDAYGTVDEVNAVIGLARSAALASELDTVLEQIQSDLFAIGAELATAAGKEDKLKLALISSDDVTRLEHAIDAAEVGLAELKTFVLPGGTQGAAALHLARTVCRRAERRVLTASKTRAIRHELIVYLNRLSDLLFTLARRANHLAGVADVPWSARVR
ncbi:MAG: cob(I)yrinic acid a,c-diamide adenosyltransferase [Polyangiaceae bacterium]|nr:cob(I)yrinic acid a,c-diamide adenosyltransferase [Polyangiaceae bacterium]